MLEIEYKGGNSVLLRAKTNDLWIDPMSPRGGAVHMKKQPAVQLATEADFLTETAPGVLILEGPGEYEVGSFAIGGAPAYKHTDTEADGKRSTVYGIVAADDYRIAVVGNIQPKLSEEQLETLGIVDILIVPVGGGGYTLDAMNAAEIVKQVEPRVVIPVHYADGATEYEVPQESVDGFIKELGVPIEEFPKVKLKSASSLPQTLTIYKITRS